LGEDCAWSFRYTELHPDVRLLDREMEILLMQIEMAQN